MQFSEGKDLLSGTYEVWQEGSNVAAGSWSAKELGQTDKLSFLPNGNLVGYIYMMYKLKLPSQWPSFLSSTLFPFFYLYLGIKPQEK